MVAGLEGALTQRDVSLDLQFPDHLPQWRGRFCDSHSEK